MCQNGFSTSQLSQKEANCILALKAAWRHAELSAAACCLGLGLVCLMSGFQARLFEVEIVLDAMHGLVADHALVAQFDQGPALRS